MIFSTVTDVASSVISCVPPGLIFTALAAFVDGSKYLPIYLNEMFGSFLMIAGTFSAGQWFGLDSVTNAWLAHAGGVILSDKLCGGQHVNPAVSVSMWKLGMVSYTEMYVRIAGQMAGGLITFPILRVFSDYMGWNALQGPTYVLVDDGTSAFINEGVSTFLLCAAIFVFNFEFDFGNNHYLIKQSLTAAAIRILIEYFPETGPAMNPMLGTCYAIYSSGFEGMDWSNLGAFPLEPEHYMIYWIAPIIGAYIASHLYLAYSWPLSGPKLDKSYALYYSLKE